MKIDREGKYKYIQSINYYLYIVIKVDGSIVHWIHSLFCLTLANALTRRFSSFRRRRENVPNGELPRHIQLYLDRYLCDKIVPGNRVTVTGIYSIKKSATKKGSLKDKLNIGIRQPYLRVVGIQIETDAPMATTQTLSSSGSIGASNFLTSRIEEEEEMRRLVKSPNVYDQIAKSIAPSIYGFHDVKKAIACLLFGGSRKRLPDGLTRRGDINILLLGDPGTAKSQLLKFVERVAPIGVRNLFYMESILTN